MGTANSTSYIKEGIRDFDPVHTFECGQCFRWEKQPDGSYAGAAMGRIVNIRFDVEPVVSRVSGGPSAQLAETNSSGSQQTCTAERADQSVSSDVHSGRLTITPCTEEEFEQIWRPYLDLDRDYGEIKTILAQNDEVMKRACEYGYGIRILKQDLWETIVSFIISQNNNIPRIKGCIERLCNNFGEPITAGAEIPARMPVKDRYGLANSELEQGTAAQAPDENGSELEHDIPAPEVLAGLTEEDLAPVRLGYRARYLIETAKTVCEAGLPRDFDELSALCGVGPKVASCIALFGMQDYASFPIDVWVMKVMHELYGLPEKNKKAMAAFARDHFGELGGFAQQYLFYYMRDQN